MLNRNVSSKILHFIQNPTKKALLVTGARQVGKTFLIRELLKQEKCDFIEINFLENSIEAFSRVVIIDLDRIYPTSILSSP